MAGFFLSAPWLFSRVSFCVKLSVLDHFPHLALALFRNWVSGLAKQVLALTSGDWMVEGIVDLDEKAKKLWFMGTKATPLERHLFEVGLDGKGLRQVTQRPGSHGVTLDHAHQTYIDTLSSPAGPPTITQRKLADDSEVRAIFAAKDDKIAKLGLTAPEFTTVKTSDRASLASAGFERRRQ